MYYDIVESGKRIKEMRKKAGMTQAELAEKLGCSPTNLYNKFKRDNFTEKDLKEIAQVLECTFEGNFVLNDTQERI